jgi:hypothetical protein
VDEAAEQGCHICCRLWCAGSAGFSFAAVVYIAAAPAALSRVFGKTAARDEKYGEYSMFTTNSQTINVLISSGQNNRRCRAVSGLVAQTYMVRDSCWRHAPVWCHCCHRLFAC